LAVLTILAIAAAFVLPRVAGSRDRLTLESAAIQLASGLKRARAATLRAGQEHALVLDLAQRRYWADDAVTLQRLPRGISIAVEPRPGVSADAGPAVFRFRPDGSASGGKITLRGGGRTADITVDWLTGATRIEWQR
jgi:general secretion pathway protein H